MNQLQSSETISVLLNFIWKLSRQSPTWIIEEGSPESQRFAMIIHRKETGMVISLQLLNKAVSSVVKSR